jgi:CBS domain-containing protein
MNRAPLTVHKEMSAARVHRTFVTLGMRHLCVMNNRNRVVGIITRKDLEHAAEHGAPVAPQALDMSHSVVASSSRAWFRPRSSISGCGSAVTRASNPGRRSPQLISLDEGDDTHLPDRVDDGLPAILVQTDAPEEGSEIETVGPGGNGTGSQGTQHGGTDKQ